MIALITGILVRQDATAPLERVEFDPGDIHAIHGFVGGYVQAVDIDRPPSVLWVNEDGGLEVNKHATLLLWLHATQFRDRATLYGDVLVTGRPDDDGHLQSVPDWLLELLFNTTVYRMEVQTRENGPWDGNELRFNNWQAAYANSLGLASRWSLVRHVRVVPAE